MVNSVILLCLSWILKCYGLSPETTQLSYILVMIHNGMAMFLWPASFVLPNMLRACNDVRFTMEMCIRDSPLIRKKLKEYINGYIVTDELEDMEHYVVPASLHDDQGIMGCLELARRALENDH